MADLQDFIPKCDAGMLGDENDSASDEDTEPEIGQENKESDDSEESSGDDDDESEDYDSDVHVNAKNSRDSREAQAQDFSWKYVTLMYRLHGTLRELAEDPKKSVLSIDKTVNNIFDSGGNQENSEESKKSTNHISGGMYITEINSDFPCALMMTISAAAEQKQSFTPNGKAGTYAITPMKKVSGIEEPLAEIKRTPQSPFFKKYPGWNLENIEEGIVHFTDKYSLVKFGHPVVEMFNNARKKQGKKALTVKNQRKTSTPGFFCADRKGVDQCLQTIKNAMEKNLQMKNLYDMTVSFARAFTDENEGQWDDPAEIYDGISQTAAKDRVLDRHHNLYITVKHKFRPL